MTNNQFRKQLEGVRGSSEKYTAKCPGHDDQNNSLSVCLADDGEKILIHCHAGCTPEHIMEKLGRPMSDLFTAVKMQKPKVTSEREYKYVETNGQILYSKKRIDYSDGAKSFRFWQPNGVFSLEGVKRVPYNLPAVASADKVYFVEGEKCADAINTAGGIGTTLDSGANSKWKKEYSDYFAGKEVIIIPDNDNAGMMYAIKIAQKLQNSTIVQLPGLNPGEDIYDWLEAGHTLEEIESLPGLEETSLAELSVGKNPKKTQAEIMLELVENSGAEIFQSDEHEFYAAIPIDGHVEVQPIKSTDFALWLQRLSYKNTGKPARSTDTNQVISVLSSKARFEEKAPIKLSIRVAERDGSFFLDLTNPQWQAIKITPDGWSVCDSPPIMFVRYRHQLPQVMPRKGGDIYKVLDYINIQKNQVLFIIWLVSCFVPGIIHAILDCYGVQGSAKSTTSEFLKIIIDPSIISTLTLLNDLRSLAVVFQKHYFLPFDNVSYIPGEISDTLCKAVTGAGIQQRKLFTDDEDVTFIFKRCLGINGINNAASRPDLLDRSILIELDRISETDRRELRELQEAFRNDLPDILGGILDTLSKAMAIFPTINLTELPRMADFAIWGYAIGEALGGKGQTFIEEYRANRGIQNTEAIAADTVATLIVELANRRPEWNGTVSELYNELTVLASDINITTRSKQFPADSARLGKHIRVVKSNLEDAGIIVDIGRSRRGTQIKIKSQNLPTHHTPASQTSETSA